MARNEKSEESCGNGGAVESVESQKQASHPFHETLGNLAKGDEIPTFPQLGEAERESGKPKGRFPTFPPRFAMMTPGLFPTRCQEWRISHALD